MWLFVTGTLALVALFSWATWRTAQVLELLPPGLNLLLLPAENVSRLVLMVICIGLGQTSGLPHAQLGWAWADPGRDIVGGMLIGAVVAVVLPPLTQFLVKRFGPQVYSPIVITSILPRSRREWVLVPVALVSAVLLEELLFRSLLLGGFAGFAPPLLLAAVWSLVFGAMHLPQGSLGMAVAAVLGLLLSAIFLATASLLAPFVAHYVINLVQLVWAARDTSWLESYGRLPSRDADASSHS